MQLTKDTRMLVTGCGGMLGAAVYEVFKPLVDLYPTDIDLNESWLQYLDVRDADAVKARVDLVQPDIVLNLAALTNLETCDYEPSNAYRTNSRGQQNLARATPRTTKLIYISTAGVFSGMNRVDPYTENDRPGPINVYGRTKLEGELYADLVIRAGWMMGGGIKDKKFVHEIVKQIGAGATQIRAVIDKVGTPTYTLAFAQRLVEMLRLDVLGLRHLVCAGSATRYEVAKEIVRYLNPELDTIPVHSAEFEKRYPVPRAASEELTSVYGPLLPNWKECLEHYIRTEFQSQDNG